MDNAIAPALVRCEPDGIHLALHPGQQGMWDSVARLVFGIAGTQSGKTSFGPWWLWREIQEQGPGDYLAVTASYDLFKLKMLPELESVFVHTLGWGHYRASDRLLDCGDVRIILRSAESEGGLESATAKAAWLDECGQDSFSLETWEAVLRRLSLARGRVLGTTTLYNLGWIVDLLERWKRHDADMADYEFIQWSSLDNPVFPQAEFERARREMPAWRFSMFYLGQPARPAGLIYSDFDTTIHWTAPFPIPDGTDPEKPAWERYLGVDPGGANTGLVWIAREPETGLCYVYRELHTGDLSTPALVEKVNSYEKVKDVWGGAASETQFRRDWTAAGLLAQEPIISSVEQGIDRVAAMFKTNRLYVFNNCHLLRDQLATYSRDVDEKGETTDRIKNKERYHLLDALRYVVSGMSRQPFKVWTSSHYTLR